PAEERVVNELKSLGKPFIVVLNSKNPNDQQTQKLRGALQEKYGVCVLAVDVKNMNSAVISDVMESILSEFPLQSVKINMPKWMRTFEATNPVIQQIIGEVLQKTNGVQKMKDCDVLQNMFQDSQDVFPCQAVVKNMGQGVVECEIEARPELFFRMITQQAGEQISDEYSLMHYIKRLSYAKTQFDRVEQALEMVEQNGYGIVMPEQKEMMLETPQVFKQGAQYGVKLKASAPTLHIMRVDVDTTVAPIVGSQQQCEYMLSSFQENPEQIWDTNMFGKSMSQLVQESLRNKSGAMPQDVQNKLRKTVGRVINENKGGLLCILL
ncbi:MAG: stage IV sporulation protein A, partial [Clostridia bacterium]|nr:stage IV sporulation protein A [Clostridia bacterium]